MNPRYVELAETLKRLYTSPPAIQKQIVATSYSPDAVFCDPFVYVHGKSDVFSQFKSLPSLFRDIQYSYDPNLITSTTVEGGEQVQIQNVQTYFVGKKEIKMNCTTQLTVMKDAEDRLLVTRHEDIWEKNYFKYLPLYESFGRKFTGKVTCFFINLFVK